MDPSIVASPKERTGQIKVRFSLADGEINKADKWLENVPKEIVPVHKEIMPETETLATQDKQDKAQTQPHSPEEGSPSGVESPWGLPQVPFSESATQTQESLTNPKFVMPYRYIMAYANSLTPQWPERGLDLRPMPLANGSALPVPQLVDIKLSRFDFITPQTYAQKVQHHLHQYCKPVTYSLKDMSSVIPTKDNFVQSCAHNYLTWINPKLNLLMNCENLDLKPTINVNSFLADGLHQASKQISQKQEFCRIISYKIVNGFYIILFLFVMEFAWKRARQTKDLNPILDFMWHNGLKDNLLLLYLKRDNKHSAFLRKSFSFLIETKTLWIVNSLATLSFLASTRISPWLTLYAIYGAQSVSCLRLMHHLVMHHALCTACLFTFLVN